LDGEVCNIYLSDEGPWWGSGCWRINEDGGPLFLSECYSTREAADAARGNPAAMTGLARDPGPILSNGKD